MKNLSEHILGLIITLIPISLALIKCFASEFVTNFVKELFNSKTKKKADLIFYVIIVFLALVGLSVILKSYLVVNSNKVETENLPIQSNIKNKTDAEVVLEAGQIALDVVKEGFINNKDRKNELLANRKQKLVYQVGDIKDNKGAVLKLYKKLQNIHSLDISRFFIFELSKNKFLVYKNDGFTEIQINDSLDFFKTQIDSIEPLIEVVDLIKYCKLKESVMETEPLKFKKEKIEIPCYKCN